MSEMSESGVTAADFKAMGASLDTADLVRLRRKDPVEHSAGVIGGALTLAVWRYANGWHDDPEQMVLSGIAGLDALEFGRKNGWPPAEAFAREGCFGEPWDKARWDSDVFYRLGIVMAVGALKAFDEQREALEAVRKITAELPVVVETGGEPGPNGEGDPRAAKNGEGAPQGPSSKARGVSGFVKKFAALVGGKAEPVPPGVLQALGMLKADSAIRLNPDLRVPAGWERAFAIAEREAHELIGSGKLDDLVFGEHSETAELAREHAALNLILNEAFDAGELAGWASDGTFSPPAPPSGYRYGDGVASSAPQRVVEGPDAEPIYEDEVEPGVYTAPVSTPLSAVHGIGDRLEARLHAVGITSVEELAGYQGAPTERWDEIRVQDDDLYGRMMGTKTDPGGLVMAAIEHLAAQSETPEA